jgi:hypothetical protein
MNDLDDLIDSALSAKQEPKPKENQKPVAAVYSRKKKDQPLVNESPKTAKSEPTKTEAPKAETPASEPEKLSTAELKAKMHNRRQEQIQNRKKKSPGKSKSSPLQPIFYCEGPDCLVIMDENKHGSPTPKCCPTCKFMFYCSSKCQGLGWPLHKTICGKNIDDAGKLKLELYKKAWIASEALYTKTKTGDYITVIHEPGDVPASMYASIAEKSNVLNWREYIKNPLFTTSALDTVGEMAPKIQAAISNYPDKKIFMINVILDRLRDGQTTECIIRLFLGGDAESYGATMDAPTNGKITKTVTKYTRKAK